MRAFTCLLLLVTGLTPDARVVRADKPAPIVEHIQRLIRQLGHSRPLERTKARLELEALGPEVLPALRQAAKSDDAEISRTARELVTRLEEVADFIAPRKVRLKFTDAPLAVVLAELSKQSGPAAFFRHFWTTRGSPSRG